MVQPDGSVVGIDFAGDRINFAVNHYGNKDGIEFKRMDLRAPLDDLGRFDFIWIVLSLSTIWKGPSISSGML